MNKLTCLLLAILLHAINSYGQHSMDSVLAEIARNNKTIITNAQIWEAKKIEYKTGLTLYDPTVEFDFMHGTPANAGNQTDFMLIQSFDFPSAYGKKKQLSNQQISKAEFHQIAARQDVLLEAKLICINLIYENKFKIELDKRKRNAETWLSAFQKKLDQGEGNMLDVNKAKLQLIEINAAYQENISSIRQLNQKLTELNGGDFIQVADTTYFSLPIIPDFESLETEIENRDPVRKYLEQELLAGQKKVELEKAMSLPKLEAGYHYQAILGQKFNGIHLGVTLPVWENKNKVKAQQAELLVHDYELQGHRIEHYYDIKRKFEKQLNLKIILDEYESMFATYDHILLLNKALSSGQISSIEYFMESSFYYEAFENYLEAEREYYRSIAELYKHQL